MDRGAAEALLEAAAETGHRPARAKVPTRSDPIRSDQIRSPALLLYSSRAPAVQRPRPICTSYALTLLSCRQCPSAAARSQHRAGLGSSAAAPGEIPPSRRGFQSMPLLLIPIVTFLPSAWTCITIHFFFFFLSLSWDFCRLLASRRSSRSSERRRTTTTTSGPSLASSF